MIYSKILKVSNVANKKFTKAEIINFIEVDSDKIIFLCWVVPQVAKLPMALFFAWGLLIYFFGVSLLGSVGIGAIVLLVNYLLAFWNASIQRRLLSKKDKRLQFTSESINNIRTVKLDSLFTHFISKIKEVRDEEVYLAKLKFVAEAIEIFS